MTRLDEDGQPEKQCRICGEWWPADPEFYYPDFAQCKACYLERKYARRREVHHATREPDRVQVGA